MSKILKIIVNKKNAHNQTEAKLIHVCTEKRDKLTPEVLAMDAGLQSEMLPDKVLHLTFIGNLFLPFIVVVGYNEEHEDIYRGQLFNFFELG